MIWDKIIKTKNIGQIKLSLGHLLNKKRYTKTTNIRQIKLSLGQFILVNKVKKNVDEKRLSDKLLMTLNYQNVFQYVLKLIYKL